MAKAKAKSKKIKYDPKELKYGYICWPCAEARGAKWPKGHCATAHSAECEYCGKVQSLVSTTDWLWPGQKKLTSWD